MSNVTREFIYRANICGDGKKWLENRRVSICGYVDDEEYGSCVKCKDGFFHFDGEQYQYHAFLLEPV